MGDDCKVKGDAGGLEGGFGLGDGAGGCVEGALAQDEAEAAIGAGGVEVDEAGEVALADVDGGEAENVGGGRDEDGAERVDEVEVAGCEEKLKGARGRVAGLWVA